jgi:hypothetical protein
VIPEKIFWLLSIFCQFFLTETINIYQEKVVGLKKIQSWYHHILFLKSTNCIMMKFFKFYWVLVEIIVLYLKKFQNLNINKSYFCIFDGIRRNFNCRSIYKNLFYAHLHLQLLSSDCVIYQNLPILLYITAIKLISNIISNFYTYICLSCIFNS